MALVLETATLDRRDRAEAVEAAMRYAKVPATLTHESGMATDVHARVDYWDLGAEAGLLRRSSSGIRLTRTAQAARATETDRLALSLMSPGRWSFDQFRHRENVHSSDWEVVLVDHREPYEFRRPEDGTTVAFSIGQDGLGVPSDVIRRAGAHLRSSPLHAMVIAHLLQLSNDIDRTPVGAVTTMLGAATSELVRALIVTAGSDPVRQQAVLSDSLFSRTILYLQQHFQEPDLCPAKIAREHNVSVRQLYNAWAENEVSLAEWIMHQRLETARQMLIAPRLRAQTIAAVARRSGFVDTTHFARRFRATFGQSPREWRRLNGPPDVPADQSI